MEPAAPNTPYEDRATEAHRILSQLRVQSGLMYKSLSFCLEKCLDTEELFTLIRSKNAPINYRLKKDTEEKQCVQNCSIKWDLLFPQIVTEMNERTTYEAQANIMKKMMAEASKSL